MEQMKGNIATKRIERKSINEVSGGEERVKPKVMGNADLKKNSPNHV